MLVKVLESIGDGVVAVDGQGLVRVFNAAAEAMFGYEREEILGQPMDVLLPEGVRALHAVNVASFRDSPDLDRPMARGRPILALRRSGDTFSAEVRISRVPLRGGVLLCAVVRDCTERERLVQELLAAQRMEIMGTLVSSVAHDFNNLLTVILGAAGLLPRALDDVELRTELLDEISDAGRRGAALVERLLAFVRPAGDVDGHTVDVGLSLRQMRPLLERLLRSDISLILDPGPVGLLIRCDQTGLDQVLLNLVTNARDAMPMGGRLTIALRHDPAERVVVLSVADTGEGVSPEVAARMFEPLFTTKAAGRGSGLGLATVARIVSRASGRIEVQPAVGGGTVLRLCFPVAQGDPVLEALPPVLTAAGSLGRVLLVDDDPRISMLAAEALRGRGVQVVAVTSVAGAIEQVSGPDARFDLAVIDEVLPVMSGAELGRVIRRLSPGVRVVLMSGLPLQNEDPGVSVLRKPFRPEDLVACVAVHLPLRAV